MDCARTSAAGRADRGPDEVRAQLLREQQCDRWVEDWITSRIDGASQRSGRRSAPRDAWPGALRRRDPDRPVPAAGPPGQAPAWNRIRLEQRGDVTVVSLIDHQLLGEGPLAELREELRQLTAAGCCRIILNLSSVENVSSQFLEILTMLDRRCSTRPGGHLKLARVGPEVVRIIALCGLDRFFQVHPDLQAALEGPWPADASRLPRELFDALVDRPPSGPDGRGEADARPHRNGHPQAPPRDLFLTIRRGGDVLGSLRLPESGVRIGRDAPCTLRLRHPSVSRVHAWLGRRDGRLVLEDLDSSNGTRLASGWLRSDSATLVPGDSFSVGPYQLELSNLANPVVAPNDPEGEWPGFPDRETTVVDFEPPPPDGNADGQDAPQADESWPAFLKAECIEDVLVLVPTLSQWEDDETIDELRDCLDRMLRQPEPRLNVVINLMMVASLPGRVIGLIMAYLLKLKQRGGCLRLAQPSASVLVAMELVGLQALIETYPTLDEAVLTRWPE